jgi:hypothetical protein
MGLSQKYHTLATHHVVRRRLVKPAAGARGILKQIHRFRAYGVHPHQLQAVKRV